jgi:hemerythrin-like domain-containing protein
MPDTAATVRPDTRDMISVHAVFRQALAAAPRIVGGASRNDPQHAANVASYYANLLAFLHVHHEGEDALLWPKLLERAPAQAAKVQQIADQHGAVSGLLATAEAELAEWAVEPNTDHGAKLAGALVMLGFELAEHLDMEEEFVLPLAAEHLTVEEWSELPAHGMQHFSGDKVWLLLGLLFEQMPPGAPELALAKMPPPVAAFWHNEGQDLFDAFVADVRR